MSDASVPSDPDRPVFLLAPTWRCGSTLLQRLLSSSNELFVWGETEAMLHRLRTAARPSPSFATTQRQHRKEFEKRGIAGWIPNLSPPREAEIPAMRAYLRTYYAAETARLGRRRWGLKEIRYDTDDALVLLDLFPEGRVVFLLRHPVDVMSSVARVRWPRGSASPEEAAAAWAERVPGMLAMDDERCIVVRYESMLTDPEATLSQVCEHIGIASHALDRSLLENRVGASPGRATATARVVALAKDKRLRRAAKAAGYDVTAHPLV